MTSKTIKETYPVQVAEISKSESRFENTDGIIAYLHEIIEKHPVARYLGIFDHYSHTKELPDHEMNDKILDVKLIMFCFGKDLPIPEIAAIRPRSIAVVEEADRFVVTFQDAPNPQAHDAMIQWVKGIRK